jgi:hypothetical protein
MKIEIPEPLRGEVVGANEALASPSAQGFSAAVAVAIQLAGFYAKKTPELFADHNPFFYRERKHAIEAGHKSDACQTAEGFLNRALGMQTESATVENVAWLRRLFERALDGHLHLRAAIPEAS